MTLIVVPAFMLPLPVMLTACESLTFNPREAMMLPALTTDGPLTVTMEALADLPELTIKDGVVNVRSPPGDIAPGVMLIVPSTVIELPPWKLTRLFAAAVPVTEPVNTSAPELTARFLVPSARVVPVIVTLPAFRKLS